MRTAVATAVLDASLILLAPSHARAAPVYTFVNFDVPGATGSTTAFGVNNAGQVVGTYCSPGLSQDFLRNVDGTYAIISDPAGSSSTSAYGVNDTGQIVGGYSAGCVYGGNPGADRSAAAQGLRRKQ